MSDLFKRANKYSMLKDDVHATTQQVLVTNRNARNDSIRNSKPENQCRKIGKGQNKQQQPTQASLTLLNISYDKFLSMIRDLSDFRWLEPIKTYPTKQDQSRKCVYHNDHGHTIEQCRSLHYLVKRLVTVRRLK